MESRDAQGYGEEIARSGKEGKDLPATIHSHRRTSTTAVLFIIYIVYTIAQELTKGSSQTSLHFVVESCRGAQTCRLNQCLIITYMI